jgi:16S rRNA A1518/A1519 N6-dimethyltransferase RsmA/KsgA/DIM1 with predicted DNA glycosylase/AP lyase activity
MHKIKKSLEKNKYVFARAKKSLGQNFLKSESALGKIIEAGEIKKGDVILEIGPGKGALTEKLLEHALLVIAVEKDRELFEFLKIKFEKEISEKKLILVNDDILEFDISETILKFFLKTGQSIFERTLGRSGDDGQRKFSAENFRGESENTLSSSLNEKKSEEKFYQVLGTLGPRPQPDHSKTFPLTFYKIIANIPYNITGAILKKFLTAKHQPERMVLMVQHEVAQRIIASPRHGGASGKESILSISVKAYGEPKMIAKVDKRYFSPAPKVNSAIIAIKNISRKIFRDNGINEGKFWEIVKMGFAHKRKKLSGNLKDICQGQSLAYLGSKRAEDLTLPDWIALTK